MSEKEKTMVADLAKHQKAMAGEVPCPVCGVTVHPQFKCADGRIVNLCAPSNLFLSPATKL